MIKLFLAIFLVVCAYMLHLPVYFALVEFFPPRGVILLVLAVIPVQGAYTYCISQSMDMFIRKMKIDRRISNKSVLFIFISISIFMYFISPVIYNVVASSDNLKQFSQVRSQK